MSVLSTLPTGSKSNVAPPNTRIARVTLSNGYRAYHPQIDGTDKPPKQKKTVRFVKGHVTIPDVPYHSRPKTLDGASSKINPEKAEHKNSNPPSRPTFSSPEEPEPQQQQRTAQTSSVNLAAKPGQATSGIARKPAGARLRLVVRRQQKDDGTTRDAYGQQQWRKTPRFRGSGLVPILDDPIAHGRELARMLLSSSGFGSLRRDAVFTADAAIDVPRAMEWGHSVEKGEDTRLRYDEGEREAGFSLDDVVRDEGEEEGAYVIRVVANADPAGRQRKRSEVKAADKEDPEEAVEKEMGCRDTRFEEESVDESIALTETGSDLDELEGEVDYDFLRDLSLDEAEGWVPVMVAEDEEGDDWMSLTGSWMRMSVVGDAQK
ncbi:hypothetical protein VTI28DRAFT_8789 [Corynascus sepedonium]